MMQKKILQNTTDMKYIVLSECHFDFNSWET
jgi:hypothetical protein